MTQTNHRRLGQLTLIKALVPNFYRGLPSRLILVLSVSFCCMNPASLIAQGKPSEEKPGEVKPAKPEYHREMNKFLYGQKKTEEIEEYKRQYPGKSETDFFSERKQYADLEKREAKFKNAVSGVLSSKDAAGWSIERDVGISGPDTPFFSRRVRAYSPLHGVGFVLVDPQAIEDPYPTDRYENTITPEYSPSKISDLSRFFRVNSSLLRDVRLRNNNFDDARSQKLPTNPELSQSHVIIVSGARSADGTEIVTLFDLRDSGKTGALHGDMFVLASKESHARFESVLNQKLSPSLRRRVYYYGDELQNINIRKLVESSSQEFVRRSSNVARNLLEIDKRLQELASRKFDEDKLTVANGLPDSKESVDLMGPLAGDASDWLDFYNKVGETMRGRKASMVTQGEDFIRELKEGDSDVIILVAHSTGIYLHFADGPMPIQRLKDEPPRTTPSRRPRLAVLVSCETGKPAPGRSGWRNLFRKQTMPLAQILVEKGYVDKVVAPDHNIRGPESLTVLQRALDGARATSIFRDWVNWATLKRVWWEFLG
jgi:hypothetical protein